jgi:uncharacterized protein (TIGR04222 family)
VNPLDWQGPEFLAWHAGGQAVLAVAWGLACLYAYLDDAGHPSSGAELRPWEWGWLRAGAAGAAQAVVARLVGAGCVEASGQVARYRAAPGPGSDAVERAVAEAVASRDQDVKGVARAARAAGRERLGRLRARGWVPSHAAETALAVVAVSFGALTLLGLAKLVVGVQRGRPVAFLVMLLVVSVGLAALLARLRQPATRAGKRLLDQSRHAHAALDLAASSNPSSLTAEELSLAVGLFGLDRKWLLLPSLFHLFARPRGDRRESSQACSSGCATWVGSSSCSVSSGGSSSCGGGSCGGGGCGGCGGG